MVIVVLLGLGLLSTYGFFAAPYGLDWLWCGTICMFAVASCLLHVVWRARAYPDRSWIGIDVFFLTGYLIVHFSIPAAIVLGLSLNMTTYRTEFSRYFCQGGFLAALGLQAFSIGFVYASQSYIRASQRLGQRSEHSLFRIARLNYARLRLVGYLSLVVGSVALGMFMVLFGTEYVEGSYRGVLGMDEGGIILLLLSKVFLVLSVICFAQSSLHRIGRIPFADYLLGIPLGIMILILLIHGDRSGVAGCCVPVLAVYVTTRRVSLPMIVLGVLVALVAFAVIGQARTERNRGLSAISREAQLNWRQGIEEAVLSLGNSGLLTPVAINYADRHGFFMGKYQVMELMGIIPYSRRLLGTELLRLNERNGESGRVLTYEVLRHRRYGVGTTTVADLYLDLGLIGVVVGHFFVGFIAATIQFKRLNDRGNLAIRTLYYFALGAFAIMPRYAAADFLVREVLFPLMACLALCQIVATRNR
jgi:oligosaccharide repeat unit polymerase